MPSIDKQTGGYVPDRENVSGPSLASALMKPTPLGTGNRTSTSSVPVNTPAAKPQAPAGLTVPPSPAPLGPPAPINLTSTVSPVSTSTPAQKLQNQNKQKATEIAASLGKPAPATPTPTVTKPDFTQDATSKTGLNSQGLAADQIGKATEANAQRTTIQAAVDAPGTIQQGPNGFQAINQNNVDLSGNFVNKAGQAETANQEKNAAEVAKNTKMMNDAATAAGVSSVYDPSIGFWVNSSTGQAIIPPSNEPVITGKFGQEQGGVIVNGGSQYYGLTTGDAEAIEKAGADVKKKYDEAITKQKTQASKDEATALIRGGQAGGLLNSQVSGTAATKAGTSFAGAGGSLKQLQDEYDKAISDLSEEGDKAVQNAKDAALTAARTGKSSDLGAAGAAKDYIAEVRAKQAKTQADYNKQQKEVLAIQKADVQEGGAIYSKVKAGEEMTPLEAQALDEQNGRNPGTTMSLFKATQKIEVRKEAKESADLYKDGISIQKDLADLEDIPMNREIKQAELQSKLQSAKKASYEEMGSIFDVMKKAPPGLPLQIGDASYFGISGGAVFEKDAENNGRIGYKDMNGDFKVQSIGFMGDPADFEEVYVDGQPMLRNKKTRQMTPISSSAGVSSTDTGWDTIIPVGSKGGQCGAFCHNFVEDYPYGLNTLNQKIAAINVPKGEVPQKGDIGVQAIGGDTGHVFVVQGTFKDESGKEFISYMDSNRGLDERVRVGTMPLETATIKGFFRGKVNPKMITGTDKPSSDDLGQSTNTNPFITPGIPMSATQMQDAEQKFSTAKSWVAELLDGTDAKDVPAELRPTVKQMAKNQGWKDPKAPALEEKPDDYNTFATEYQSTLGMSLPPEKVKAEYDKYVNSFEGSRTLSKNEEIAKNIFEGNSHLNIAGLPMGDKTDIDTALAKLAKKAKESGDVVGELRASAGGKDVSDAFLTSYEKSASVLNRIGDLQRNIQDTATGPITGLIASKNPYNTKAREISAQLAALVPGLARGVYGEVGVLTDRDVELYSRTLPNLKDTQAVNKVVLSATLRGVANSIEKKLQTQAAGGRDVSGYIDSYVDLKNQANELLAQSDPSTFRVNNGALYKKEGNDWVIQK